MHAGVLGRRCWRACLSVGADVVAVGHRERLGGAVGGGGGPPHAGTAGGAGAA